MKRLPSLSVHCGKDRRGFFFSDENYLDELEELSKNCIAAKIALEAIGVFGKYQRVWDISVKNLGWTQHDWNGYVVSVVDSFDIPIGALNSFERQLRKIAPFQVCSSTFLDSEGVEELMIRVAWRHIDVFGEPGRVWAEEFGTYFLVETEKAYYIVVRTEGDKYVPAQGLAKHMYSLGDALEKFHDFVRV